jgi:hypothetical protein
MNDIIHNETMDEFIEGNNVLISRTFDEESFYFHFQPHFGFYNENLHQQKNIRTLQHSALILENP